MSEGSGFTSMAGARAEGDAPEIGIGMLGYAFMGKAPQPCDVEYCAYDVPAAGRAAAGGYCGTR